MWQNRRNIFYVTLSLCCLAAGTLLYSMFRPLSWMPGISSFTETPGWVHQQLPDALWVASFSAVLMCFETPDKTRRWALWWPLLLSYLLEWLQALNLWPGTADLWDVLAASSGSLFMYMIVKFEKDEQKNPA